MEARKLQREIEQERLVQKEFNEELEYFIKKRTAEIKTKVEHHIDYKLKEYCDNCGKQLERAQRLIHVLESASSNQIIALTKRADALRSYSLKIQKQIDLLGSNVEKDLINLLKEISTRAYDIKERIQEAMEKNESRELGLKEKVELLNESGLASKLTSKITKNLEEKLSLLTSELKNESKDRASITEEMNRSIQILEENKKDS